MLYLLFGEKPCERDDVGVDLFLAGASGVAVGVSVGRHIVLFRLSRV